MGLSIFYVRADSDEGDNLDLMVRAVAKGDCESIWRKHYDLSDTDKPKWVGQIPGVMSLDETAGAIDWGSIIPK